VCVCVCVCVSTSVIRDDAKAKGAATEVRVHDMRQSSARSSAAPCLKVSA